MPAKRHHFLPQFYLRGFLKHNRNQLTVIKMDNGDFFKTDTKNVGLETDWNRVGDDRSSTEEHFAKIDGQTSRLLSKIDHDETLPTDVDDISLLFYFIARLSVHNPSLRDRLRKDRINHLKHVGRWQTSSPGIYYEANKDKDIDKLAPYERVKKAVENLVDGKYKISFGHGYFLQHETKFIEQDLIPIFCDLHWSLLIAKDPTESFVCSDHPVFMNTGLTELSGETELIPSVAFSLPLNRRICLYAHSIGFLPEIYYISKENWMGNSMLSVPHLNSRTIYRAKRHVYAGDLNWEIATASGEKRNANSLIGKRLRI
ncbi:hypothetical protein C6499_20885 [Candidatus Poribacteria bacterium]|nr:MAG: hypothetical protein C6499_20885 [Candidatus Poribacteria bacterium]